MHLTSLQKENSQECDSYVYLQGMLKIAFNYTLQTDACKINHRRYSVHTIERNHLRQLHCRRIHAGHTYTVVIQLIQ